MTIDERLDKLVERHEALTQSVELMRHDLAGLAGQVKILTSKVDTLTDALTRLVIIVTDHERRISKLEE